MHYNFIEIGTSDFDTEIQSCSNDAVGLSVDPILFYLQRLPSKPNVMRVLAAISNKDGMTDVYHVPLDTIERYGLPDWTRGCSCIGNYHPTVVGVLNQWGLDPHNIFVKTQVPVFSIKTFLNIYNVSTCDYLKIDTEGHDTVILHNYIEAVKEGITAPAKRICFESNVLSSISDVDTIIQSLIEIGYELVDRGGNTIMKFKEY